MHHALCVFACISFTTRLRALGEEASENGRANAIFVSSMSKSAHDADKSASALTRVLLVSDMPPLYSGAGQRHSFGRPKAKKYVFFTSTIMGPRVTAEAPTNCKVEIVEYKKDSRKPETYSVKICPALHSQKGEASPPLLCIPPVGVGITHDFFQPLLREWNEIGAPCEIHAPDLLGCGSSSPKPRRFYNPELWADQLLDYINSRVERPVILVVQGGLLPVALEMWRKAGKSAIVGVSFISPPPLRFFMPNAESERGVRTRFQNRPAGRGRQRLFWLLSQSTLGGAFYRYLRAGDGQPRIRSFSERNLFARSENVDSEWMQMCFEGSRDVRSRFATLAYLCGTAPGGSWRDDRSELLTSLNVPTQVLRGDGGEEAKQRLESFVACVPHPSCCGLVSGGRAVIPYENAKETAKMLAHFVTKEFNVSIQES